MLHYVSLKRNLNQSFWLPYSGPQYETDIHGENDIALQQKFVSLGVIKKEWNDLTTHTDKITMLRIYICNFILCEQTYHEETNICNAIYGVCEIFILHSGH